MTAGGQETFFYFFKTPYDLIRALKCDMAVKMVAVVLLSHCDKNGNCFPSTELIAKEAGCSARQVMRAVRRIERLHIFEVRRSKGSVSHYHFNPPAFWIFSDGSTCPMTDSHRYTQGGDCESGVPMTDSHRYTQGGDCESGVPMTDSHRKLYPLNEKELVSDEEKGGVGGEEEEAYGYLLPEFTETAKSGFKGREGATSPATASEDNFVGENNQGTGEDDHTPQTKENDPSLSFIMRRHGLTPQYWGVSDAVVDEARLTPGARAYRAGAIAGLRPDKASEPSETMRR